MIDLIQRTTVLILALVVLTFAAKSQDSLNTEPQLTKNPTTAVLLSLPLPGLGQWYTEQYWKIPLFTGTCAFTGYLFFKNNSDFNTTSDLYDQAVELGADITVIDRLNNQKEAFRNNRDIAGMIFLATYILAAVDAYVGAHLYDFDVSENIGLGVGPTRSHFAAVSLRLRL